MLLIDSTNAILRQGRARMSSCQSFFILSKKKQKILRVRLVNKQADLGATVSPTITRDPVDTLFFIDFYIRQFGIYPQSYRIFAIVWCPYHLEIRNKMTCILFIEFYLYNSVSSELQSLRNRFVSMAFGNKE